MRTSPASGDRDAVEQLPDMSETPVFQLIDLGQVSRDTKGLAWAFAYEGGDPPFDRRDPWSPSPLDARGQKPFK
jgi:hypothetical protein